MPGAGKIFALETRLPGQLPLLYVHETLIERALDAARLSPYGMSLENDDVKLPQPWDQIEYDDKPGVS
ncbi:hypothetical protein [Azotobacter beijerinckii]|uniref:hypothetical protein n=1 Tax=Azotobacter beijerinckii TaxID=170623 RepID=UPI001113C064|nr:hypothetical protein [Azotobacter beijerinckii]